jgi:hypothetical protein
MCVFIQFLYYTLRTFGAVKMWIFLGFSRCVPFVNIGHLARKMCIYLYFYVVFMYAYPFVKIVKNHGQSKGATARRPLDTQPPNYHPAHAARRRFRSRSQDKARPEPGPGQGAGCRLHRLVGVTVLGVLGVGGFILTPYIYIY